MLSAQSFSVVLAFGIVFDPSTEWQPGNKSGDLAIEVAIRIKKW
jgi:hypothetical protein